jgi:hypothetical protein
MRGVTNPYGVQPVNHPTDHLLIADSYLLPEDLFADICHIRDKMLFLTQLTGTTITNGNDDAMIFIHRGMIGELFRDMSYQLGDVIEAIEKTTAHRKDTRAR